MAGPGAQGRWQRAAVVRALYLAEDPETTWAEFYRAASALQLPPDRLLPRDLWTYRVELDEIVDFTTEAALAAFGLPVAAPDEQQWAAFQTAGERLAETGAQAIMWRSAARPAGTCLCVFTSAVARLAPVACRRVETAPVPPRGMRT